MLRSFAFIFTLIFASVILHAQTSLDTAVNFTVKDVSGTTHYLSEYLEQDKIVVIDFFTITCGPCSTYAPLINESYTHFGCNLSNVVFLGINWGADNAGVTDFGNTYGVQYPEISGTEGNGNHVVADYGVLSYPTVILIVPGSLIAEKYIWPPTTEHLDSLIILHGGIVSGCNTPVSELQERKVDKNKITRLYPLPAGKLMTCSTSLSEPGFIQVLSVSGSFVTGRIPVQPDENIQVKTDQLAPGYYILVLRNVSGTVLDQKPFIVLNLH